jgi:hypothetical protein
MDSARTSSTDIRPELIMAAEAILNLTPLGPGRSTDYPNEFRGLVVRASESAILQTAN